MFLTRVTFFEICIPTFRKNKNIGYFNICSCGASCWFLFVGCRQPGGFTYFLNHSPAGTWERGLNQQPHLRYQAHLTTSICSPSRDQKQVGGCDAWNLWCSMLHQCLTHPGWGPLERKGNMRHSEWLDHLRSQWFCTHIPSEDTPNPHKERNSFINCGWRTSGVSSRGMWVRS